MEVGGLTARPTFFPSDLIFQSSGVTALAQLDVDVDLIRARLGERLQQDLRLRAHQVHVEEELASAGRSVRTTAGPNEMFGTKCPSMMSRCSQSAPERVHPGDFPGQAGRNPQPAVRRNNHAAYAKERRMSNMSIRRITSTLADPTGLSQRLLGSGRRGRAQAGQLGRHRLGRRFRQRRAGGRAMRRLNLRRRAAAA